MAITLHELAKAAGVSVATVSRALTPGKHPVNPKTREHILELAEELGYRPNLIARGLRTDQSFTIGIIVDSIVSPFSPSIIRGIQDHLHQYDYFSLIINADWDPENETRAIRDLIDRSIDGFIFVESWLHSDSPNLDLADKPYVFVHRLFSRNQENSVAVDDVYGAHLAIDHLAALGHRRIAFINGPNGWDATNNRLQGYLEALEKWGITFEPELLHTGNWELQSGLSAVRSLLGLSERPTAIFAANDLMALGAIYGIQEVGLRVPDDIAVVGYDDREIAALARPTITTVTLPTYEMGLASAKMLLNVFGSDLPKAEPVTVKGKLIVRESCGALEGGIPLDQYRTHTTPRRLLADYDDTQKR